MNENTKDEMVNFIVAIKQLAQLIGTELPRFKGMADAVSKAGDDLKSCIRHEN